MSWFRLRLGLQGLSPYSFSIVFHHHVLVPARVPGLVSLNKARFHNYVFRILYPNCPGSRTKPRDSTTKAGTLPQLYLHDSTTMIRRFHNRPTTKDSTTRPSRFQNQTDAIPQPKPHDVTNKISGFHNHTTSIPQPQCCNSFHPTPLVSAYKVFTSMISERPRPLGQCTQSLHIHPVLTQSSHPWFPQRSHPLGQCVQSLHIHNISKIPTAWSVRTKTTHP